MGGETQTFFCLKKDALDAVLIAFLGQLCYDRHGMSADSGIGGEQGGMNEARERKTE